MDSKEISLGSNGYDDGFFLNDLYFLKYTAPLNKSGFIFIPIKSYDLEEVIQGYSNL